MSKQAASIGKLFLFTFTSFLILPLAVLCIFFLAVVYDTNKEKISHDLQFLSHTVASKLNARLNGPVTYLKTLAEFEDMRVGDELLNKAIKSGIGNYHVFDSIYILDNEKNVKEMSFGPFSRYSKDDFIGIRLSDVSYFTGSGIYWSRPFVSAVTNNYIVRISRKYENGYVVGDINLKFLTDSLLNAKLSDTTKVFVVDADGHVISNTCETDKFNKNFFSHPVVQEVYKGRHIVFHYSINGVKYTGAGFKIPLADWYLVLEEKDFEAFRLFNEIFYVTVLAIFVTTFFIFLVLYLIRKKLIVPIRLLTDRSGLLAEGHFADFEDAEKTVFTELRVLYESFAEMAKKIDEREKALRDKEEYVRSIFDSTVNTGIIVMTSGTDPLITDANRGAQLISGYKMSELMGLPPDALVKDVGDEILRMRREAVKRDSVISSRFMMTKKNGIHFPALCTLHPLEKPGAGLDAFILVFIDITEVTRVQRALEDEKERLDVTLRSIGEGVLATDKKGRIALVNSSAEMFLSQKHRAMIGHRISDVLQIYDYKSGEDLGDDLTRTDEISRRTFRANIVTKQGVIITVTMTSSVMLSNKGEIVGYVYVFRDITERIKMEQELLSRKKQLEEINRNLEIRVTEEAEKRRKNEQMLFEQSKFAAMGQMISAIAHQWRQPLNALALYTQDIEDAYEVGEVDSEYLSLYVANSMSLINHMSMTIDDFRNFFHSEKIHEKVNLISVVVKSLSLVSTQLKNQNIDFSIQVSDGDESIIFKNELPEEDFVFGKDISISESEMKQVVLNILQNARDAITDRRSKTLHKNGNIYIYIRHYDDKIVTEISNDGGFIPEDYISRIFDPYFTTKPEGEGTGIGLYMSKIMIEDHMDGFLIVENVEYGVKFTITLYY